MSSIKDAPTGMATLKVLANIETKWSRVVCVGRAAFIKRAGSVRASYPAAVAALGEGPA